MSAQPLKILSIEDDASMRRIVSGCLLARGYRVFEAEDGRQGLDLFRREKPDVVLLDLRLPEIDGMELLPIFAAESPQTPILIVSGTGAMSDVIEAMHLGAWDFLLKPIADFSELLRAIEESHHRAATRFAGNGSQKFQEKEERAQRERLLAAVDSLRQSENLLKNIVDNSPSIVYVKDAAGRYLMINPRFEEYLSLTINDTLGKTDADLFDGETAEVVMRNDRRVLENGEMITCDEQVPVCGKPTTFLSTKFPIRDAVGNITAVAGISTDITERTEANRKLQASEEKLRKISDSVLDAVVMIDESGKVAYWNPAAERIFGYGADEILGRNANEMLLPPELKTTAEKGLLDFLQTGKGRAVGNTIELAAVRKNGEVFPTEISVSRITLDNRYAAVAVIRDIGERKNAEKELVRYREHLEELVIERTRELEEANRRIVEEKQSKELLMAMVSHELRTPLHGILSYASFGINKTKGGETEQSKRFFEKIDRSGRELLDMVNDLLDLAKLEAGKDELQAAETDVYELIVREVDEFTLPASEKCICFDCPQPRETVRANLDVGKITRVVRNLISNAVKYSPHGSTIHVSLREDEGCFSVSVADQGEGIPEDELNIIFGTFSQSRNRRAGGTGLGLAICREIVSAHQGQIWAENGPQGGAVVTFRIPLDPFQSIGHELGTHAIH